MVLYISSAGKETNEAREGTVLQARYDKPLEGYPSWPKGTDCKSVSCAFTGSNPVPSIDAAGWSSWQLVGLITRRSQVQVLSPQLC